MNKEDIDMIPRLQPTRLWLRDRDGAGVCSATHIPLGYQESLGPRLKPSRKLLPNVAFLRCGGSESGISSGLEVEAACEINVWRCGQQEHVPSNEGMLMNQVRGCFLPHWHAFVTCYLW